MTEPRQAAATLTIASGPSAGRRFSIDAAAITIGRHDQCDIQVEDRWLSRQHARIAWTGSGYVIEDLGSTNGTFVNGERIAGSRALKSGDLLRLGEQVELAFRVSEPAPRPEESVRPVAGEPRSAPLSVQQGSFLQQRTWVWVLALLGALLILLVGGVAYYLLSDKGQEVADTPAEQDVLPQPATATPTPIPLAPPTVSKFLISTHSGSGSQPVVWGDYVVWGHKAISLQPLGTYRIDIYAYNLTTEQETLVTSVKARDAYPLVAGNLLVWLEYPSFTGYRLAAEDAGEFRITNFGALLLRMRFEEGHLLYDRAFYTISDHILAWSDAEAKDTHDILAYDLDRNERVRITDDSYDQTWPAAAGSLIVWADERKDEGDIYGYDMDTREEFPIGTAPLTQTMPSTDGRHVVWIDGRDGNDDVYAYDLESQTEFPVFTGPGVRFLPGVWGNFVIWMEQDSDARCVYGYDLRLDEKFAIACEGGWPSDARIWDNVVVWTEYREEDKARVIYRAILEY